MARRHLYALLLAVAAAPVPVAAQSSPAVSPAPGTADQLAAQMRLLAGNANDLTALLTAGELSVKLDDLGAAASFFARADRIDPHNGRAKAGEAAILVHAERPGEALRYFVEAERYGAQLASFAAERGLAYDLIGEQERAQRDYRLALRSSPDEETRRRYALSLAIAGQRELADQELRPLLRQSDRGAWRARAFVLALGGDIAEAGRIATTMMPPGTAAGLQPFLERLPTLGPVDRAFAVHFGEVRSTPERVADARKAPPLAALGPDPYAPRVAVAATPEKGSKRPDKKKRGKPDPVQVAVATPAPEPLPQTPAYRPGPGAQPVLASHGAAPAAWPTAVRPEMPSRAPTVVATRAPSAPEAAPPRSLAGTTTLSTPGVGIAAAPRQAAPVASRTPASPPPETNVTVATTTAAVKPAASPPPPRPSTPAPTDAKAPVVVMAPPKPAVLAPPRPSTPVPTETAVAVTASPKPTGAAPFASPPLSEADVAVATTAAPASPVAASIDRPAPTSEPIATTAPAEPVAIPPTAAEPLAAASPPPADTPAAAPPASATAAGPSLAESTPVRIAPVRRDDGALSRIVAGLAIPGTELGIAAPRRASPPVAVAVTPAPPPPDPAAEKAEAERAAAKVLADKRAADRKAAAEKKALAEKKAAAAKKAEEEREAAAQRKLERANPERIWVQVAGGANEHDLRKAWAAAKAKGGDSFAGHATGWTTPLRFTNRVLAGPFKTGEEARAFVNKLKGAGMSTFTFTSEAGQVVTKLSAE